MRPKQYDPTDGELVLLHVLWGRGATTIAGFQEALAKTRPMGYTTLQSNLQKMIHKGLIQRDERHGKFVTYTPLISQHDARMRMIKRLAEKLFGGSVQKMLSYAVSGKKPSKDEMTALKKKVSEAD